MSGELEAILKSGADAVGVQLNRQMIEMLVLYLVELKEWNQKINLTSLKDDTSIIIDHFIDSLSVVPHLPASGRILDAGSGAGFPGLPIKIARPELDITLLESKRKKINFLKQIILLLNLSHITVLHGRIESFVPGENIPLFDIIIARAFTRLGPLLKLARPLLQDGGYVIAMKGKEGYRELKKNGHILKSLSMKVVKGVDLQLPETHKKRSLFFIVKT